MNISYEIKIDELEKEIMKALKIKLCTMEEACAELGITYAGFLHMKKNGKASVHKIRMRKDMGYEFIK